MKAKLLKKIRGRFNVLYYWDEELKQSMFMSKHKITGKISKTSTFESFYGSICWGWNLDTYFKLEKLLHKRLENRRQRELNKEFNNVKKT